MRGHDLFRCAAIFAVVLCYSTILLGGNVVTSGNGLACPAWPSCFGNGNYLPAFQGGVIAEWSHRVLAFFLSTCVLVLAVLAVAFERHRRVLLRLSFGALALVVTEALLGALVVENQLSGELVIAHLGIATVLFGLLLLIAALSNLRELPRRWVRWAQEAAEGTPAPPTRSDVSERDPAPPDPARTGVAPREA
ncbi:MAG TPA: COX15/CtaA family protein [Thermoplasmata archaeon]|nr:COX15/CtaA family protein [Thermoplasmata archaeon]